jgi:hypothetical protein
LLQVIAHLVGIPLGRIEQALHAIWGSFSCQFF